MELRAREMTRASPVDRDDDQQEGVFHRLQEVGVVEHVGVVIQSHAEVGLGGKVIPLLHRVDEHIDEGIDHECCQKQQSGQQVEPGFSLLFHRAPRIRQPESGWKRNTFSGFRAKRMLWVLRSTGASAVIMARRVGD